MVIFDDGRLRIRRLVVGSLATNVYVPTSGGEGVIVDAAAEPERILAEVSGLRVKLIVTTHGHADHHQAAGAVAAALGIPIRIHPADAGALAVASEPLGDGETISFGRLGLSVLHTPGHTPGSVCFWIAGHLFSGDTLFPGGPGATRFPGSSFPQIISSIESRLFVLGEDTVVYPGHGEATTIKRERPHLAEWIARGW